MKDEIVSEDDESSSSQASEKSTKARKELKQNLKKKFKLVQKKSKGDPKKMRNTPGLGMQTIIE